MHRKHRMNKILVVDDQEQNTYLLKTLFQGHGYQVREAANGAAALEIARADPPAIIISDILMPVMDGFSLCQAWMNDNVLKSVPFVFYTATYTDSRDEELALGLGAVRFIVKPIENDKFVEIIRQVVGEVESGAVPTPHLQMQEEITYYRMYSERLIRKLEDKMLEVEAANQALEEDILQRKKAEEEITRLLRESERRLNQVEALHSIDLAINASMDLNMTLNMVLKYCQSLLDMDAGNILLNIPGLQQFEVSAQRGFKFVQGAHVIVRADSNFAGRVVRERATVVIRGNLAAQADRNFAQIYEREGFLNYAGSPLITKGRVTGVLEVYHRSTYRPEGEWLHVLETLASQAAIAIEHAQLFSGLQQSNLELIMAYDATIAGWSRAMELRERDTEGHTQQIAELTLKLARAMDIDETQLQHIHRGAMLHDIGNIGISDRILLKPDPLTESDWVEVRKHPDFAFDMLASIRYLQPALDIPRCHHERWDGTGYPRGLKGESIPIAARIFAVVDVWDVLLRDRPYRKAWSRQEALTYLKEQSGKYFDPQVVSVFLKIIETG
jgi:response regulator RpfG family c-di-GMP phosphodiesterase